jgi:hypothetical protein
MENTISAGMAPCNVEPAGLSGATSASMPVPAAELPGARVAAATATEIAPHASIAARHRHAIGRRRGNAVTNSRVSSASAIVPIMHGTSTPGAMSEPPVSTLTPRHAVIPASVSASKPNIRLSRRRQPRSTSAAYDAPTAAIASGMTPTFTTRAPRGAGRTPRSCDPASGG